MRSGLVAACWLVACSGGDDTGTTEPVCGTACWPGARPIIQGGEVALGRDSVVRISPVPRGSQVSLYAGRGGEGAGACDLPLGACLDLDDPAELFHTVTADGSGQVEIRVPADRFTEPGPLAWQALVIDPRTPSAYALTEAAVRHVGVGTDDADIRFADVTRRAGVELLTTGNTHSGGVAFVDLNGDLWPDLFVANGSTEPNALFRNNGDGTFERLEGAVPKPDQAGACAGVKVADVDNDGDIDLIVPVDNAREVDPEIPQSRSGGPNLLYLNEGGFTFAPDPAAAAAASGLADPLGARNSSAAVADVDLDGCIDVYFTRWALAAEPGGDNPDRMVRSNCDGTFTDVTQAMGADGEGRDGLVSFFWDHDLDRYPELYVGNNAAMDDGAVFDPRDVFYRNVGGTRFEPWTQDPIGDDAWAAMGVDVGDIDADGHWDLYVTDVFMLPPVPRGNVLYKGLPGGRLSANRCHEAGLCFGYNSWATNFEDFDNDGWLDVWVGSSSPPDPDMVFLNQGDGTFVTHRQAGFLNHRTRSGTTADYDGDGDMDVFLWDESSTSSLWANSRIDAEDPSGARDAHWVSLKLVGQHSNRAAIGAVVRAQVGDVTLMRRVTGGDSAHAHRQLVLHFGLGEHESLDRVEITWPQPEARSPVQVVTGLSADRVWIIDEVAGKVPHAFVEPSASWSAGTLRVVTASTYGGRPDITVEGFGPLAYDAGAVQYSASFAVAKAPTEVTLTSSYGASSVLPVDVRP